MKRFLSIVGIGVCCVLLLLVRAFEESLFYDPLLEYFKMDYKTLPLPEMDIISLWLGIAFRYSLNALLSLCIIWLVFWDKGIIKLSILLYIVLFIVFFIAFATIVSTSDGQDSMLLLFYVRRFLIHPVFLLLLLPAFYFQTRKSR